MQAHAPLASADLKVEGRLDGRRIWGGSHLSLRKSRTQLRCRFEAFCGSIFKCLEKQRFRTDEMLVTLTTRPATYKNATWETGFAAYRYGRVSTFTVAPFAFGFLGAMSILARGVRM